MPHPFCKEPPPPLQVLSYEKSQPTYYMYSVLSHEIFDKIEDSPKANAYLSTTAYYYTAKLLFHQSPTCT